MAVRLGHAPLSLVKSHCHVDTWQREVKLECMLRWMCGLTPRKRKGNAEMDSRLVKMLGRMISTYCVDMTYQFKQKINITI